MPQIVTVVFTRENGLKNNSRVVIEFDGGPSSQFRHDKSRGELIAIGRCRASGSRLVLGPDPHTLKLLLVVPLLLVCSLLSLSAPLHRESTNSVCCLSTLKTKQI